MFLPANTDQFEDGIEPLFVSELYGESFSYRFDVRDYPSGTEYNVTLYFAEIFFDREGAREFDVEIEGTKVLSNFDLIKETRERFRATSQTYRTTAGDGYLDIQFTGRTNNAKISGIEILLV